jgi:hypothetical protein
MIASKLFFGVGDDTILDLPLFVRPVPSPQRTRAPGCVCGCVVACVCVFDRFLERMSCAKVWACATQNRQPTVPAADCRTRIHPLTALVATRSPPGRHSGPLPAAPLIELYFYCCTGAVLTETRRHLEMPSGTAD